MTINVYVSDVFFNMDLPLTVETDAALKENAEMLINMLESVNASDIPTVEELIIDFYQRY